MKSGEPSFPTPKIKIKTTENARPALQALASIFSFLKGDNSVFLPGYTYRHTRTQDRQIKGPILQLSRAYGVSKVNNEMVINPDSSKGGDMDRDEVLQVLAGMDMKQKVAFIREKVISGADGHPRYCQFGAGTEPPGVGQPPEQMGDFESPREIRIRRFTLLPEDSSEGHRESGCSRR